MQSNPIDEWQRLTAHYRELSDDELRELAADFNDLTETAQQVLRTERRSRGLGDPEASSGAQLATNGPPETPASSTAAGAAYETSAPIHDPTVNALGFLGRPPELVPDTPDAVSEDDGPVDYTWKTPLCECDTSQQASELSEALKQAGIESWIENPATRSRYTGLGLSYPRVLVAADQLEQARAIAARPIPSEIVSETETEVPDFQPPTCPKCGAGDPVLEGVDPANIWRCEQCGQQWTETAPAEAPKTS